MTAFFISSRSRRARARPIEHGSHFSVIATNMYPAPWLHETGAGVDPVVAEHKELFIRGLVE